MTMQIQAKLNTGDIKKTLKALMRTTPGLRKELRVATRNTVVKVEKYVKIKAPHKTGETRRNVHGKVISATEGVVGTAQKAAMAIDRGARPHKIVPDKTKSPMAKSLTIPLKTAGGKYVSKKRTKTGKRKYLKKLSYSDVATAPNKRHLNVEFNFAGRVHHPGKKPQPFISSGALAGNRLAAIEGHQALHRALVAANKGGGS